MPGQAPPLPDERDQLLAYPDQQRDGIRFAAFGLTDGQARLTPTAGALSIGGLVKHVALTEQSWLDRVAGRQRLTADEAQTAYGDSWRACRVRDVALRGQTRRAPRTRRNSCRISLVIASSSVQLVRVDGFGHG